MNVKNNCWLIIPAAGTGSRMGSTHAKQYIPLLGKPMLAHSLQPFLDCDFICGITVAVGVNDEHHQDLAVLQHEKIQCCIGGGTRAESVLAGLNALQTANDNDWVMVHDAARPCITSEQLTELYETLAVSEHGGFWAIPVADTLKRVVGKHLETVDRRDIVRAQTPQMFRLGELRNALAQALANNIEITDEASAMEVAGIAAIVVTGHGRNIKVTYPEDAELAAFYLQKIQEQQRCE